MFNNSKFFILSWLFPNYAILTKLTSRGPVLFLQEELGLKMNISNAINFVQ